MANTVIERIYCSIYTRAGQLDLFWSFWRDLWDLGDCSPNDYVFVIGAHRVQMVCQIENAWRDYCDSTLNYDNIFFFFITVVYLSAFVLFIVQFFLSYLPQISTFIWCVQTQFWFIISHYNLCCFDFLWRHLLNTSS